MLAPIKPRSQDQWHHRDGANPGHPNFTPSPVPESLMWPMDARTSAMDGRLQSRPDPWPDRRWRRQHVDLRHLAGLQVPVYQPHLPRRIRHGWAGCQNVIDVHDHIPLRVTWLSATQRSAVRCYRCRCGRYGFKRGQPNRLSGADRNPILAATSRCADDQQVVASDGHPSLETGSVTPILGSRQGGAGDRDALIRALDAPGRSIELEDGLRVRVGPLHDHQPLPVTQGQGVAVACAARDATSERQRIRSSLKPRGLRRRAGRGWCGAAGQRHRDRQADQWQTVTGKIAYAPPIPRSHDRRAATAATPCCRSSCVLPARYGPGPRPSAHRSD